MFVTPETNIKILRNVPLDATYDHSIYFSKSQLGLQAQYNFFSSKVAYNLTEQTYQRLQKGYMRVAIKAENLYNCNYLMYQNTSFGNKWFYAFILGVEYINNEVSEVHFDLDPLQTWNNDYELEECFVERQHTTTDYIGDNIVPENVELGEYVYSREYEYKYEQLFTAFDVTYYTVVAVADTKEYCQGHVYDHVYSGATLYVYDTSNGDVSEINDKISEYMEKPEAVLSVYMIPSFLLNNRIPANHIIPSTTSNWGVSGILSHMTDTCTLDGYTPRNCKLYTYPYNFYNIINGNGSSLALRYEFFKGQIPSLRLYGTLCQPVQAIVYPVNYKMGPDNEIMDSESITLNNYPACSWNMDAYKAWIAQNEVPVLIHSMGNVAGTAAAAGIAMAAGKGALAGGLAGAAIGAGIGYISSVLSQMYKASIHADIAKGNINTGNVRMVLGHQHFYGGRMTIPNNFAKIIDRYFDRYGYAIKRLQLPNCKARPYWTYVKTVNCTIKGSIPRDDAVKICNIFDNGILWFADGTHTDFNMDNRPPANDRGFHPDLVHNGYYPDIPGSGGQVV